MHTKVKNLIHDSYKGTLEKLPTIKESHEEKIRNNKRSSLWVETLAKSIKNEFTDNVEVVVFHRGERNNAFKLNELLHDISVCEIGNIPSLQKIENPDPLPVIKNVIWQIESEFGMNARSITIDFNKLILGSAKNKLFICSARSTEKQHEGLRNILNELAQYCTGNVYLCFLPHPKNWNESSDKIQLWHWENAWQAIT